MTKILVTFALTVCAVALGLLATYRAIDAALKGVFGSSRTESR